MLTLRSIATHPLAFASGDPVRAASAITRLNDQWLIAQDDATHAAVWLPGAAAQALRLFPPVEGEDTFSEAAGTKDLKPDLESACTIAGYGRHDAGLLLGSGSKAARMRAALVGGRREAWIVQTADLAPLYGRVAEAMGIPADALNLEGATPLGDRLRWFQRGHANGVASAAVDLDLAALLSAMDDEIEAADIPVEAVATFNIGDVDGVPLAITDAATLPDGRIVVSAAAEDAPNNVDDGPIVGSAIAMIEGDTVTAVTPLPRSPDGEVWKVEGLAVRDASRTSLDLMAVVDQDEPNEPSLALALRFDLG